MIMEEITRIDIQGIKQFPTLPAYFNRIMSTLENEESTVDDLAEIIQQDAALSARLLRLSNSAYYGRHKRVSTIKQVIMTLGFNEVRALSLSIGVFDVCSSEVPESYLQKLWIHSLATAMAVNQVCKRVLKEDKGRIYLGGLLHDVGKIGFIMLCGKSYLRGLEGQNSDYSLHAREEIAFGVSHAQLGGWLANRWNFPEELVEMIEFHHRPDAPDLSRPDLVSAVYLSNMIASEPEIERLVQAEDPVLDSALETLRLDREVLAEVCEAFAESAPDEQSETTLEAEC